MNISGIAFVAERHHSFRTYVCVILSLAHLNDVSPPPCFYFILFFFKSPFKITSKHELDFTKVVGAQ